MRISLKLTAGFLAIAALVALVGYFNRLANKAIQAHVEELRRSALIEMVDASDMAISLQESHDALHDLIADKRRGPAQPIPDQDSDEESNRSRKTVVAALEDFQHSFDRIRDAKEVAVESAKVRGITEPSAAAQAKWPSGSCA